MMNRMMKAEVVFEAQAHVSVCVILRTADAVYGGYIDRDHQRIKQ